MYVSVCVCVVCVCMCVSACVCDHVCIHTCRVITYRSIKLKNFANQSAYNRQSKIHKYI